ncbi:MAG TPA: hypothetical protein VNK95_05690, partial [Caldilineaceae bacterium]|nr:hypothetical protein [Caldilineaceae bacterium]
MASNRFESPFLYGLHDPGGEHLMLEARKPGWIVFTEAVGHEPTNRSGVDFRQFSSRELGVICRLNNGYYPHGTLPNSSQYANFARRCANFVAASPGCRIWIIGNEPNYVIERPHAGVASPARAQARPQPARGAQPLSQPLGRLAAWWQQAMRWLQSLIARAAGEPAAPFGGPGEPAETDDPFRRSLPERFNALYRLNSDELEAAIANAGAEVITPALYARCYQLCREAIRQVPGHEDDLVLVAAVAPWNNQTVYPGNPRGDWVQYFADVL